ncbi:coagulation factor XIII B chain-like [Nothobranchius furzeri]|uniref:Coagulation factor XIII B chain-like n=1 Tax=Nothobranchius furzeri TaxID=105023 RepID=A0A9D3BXX3_NOTFU|nr:coagulation factor XIII B chain-like [Nothobranchius furzeri]
MSVRYLGLLLLVLLPEPETAQSCFPPVLSGGYFVPEKLEYAPKSSLAFSCDVDHKPLAEGWWATSVCLNGKWSPEPRCIAKASCLPPTIPNGYIQGQRSWYENGQRITVSCNSGYLTRRSSSVIRCTNGKWSLLLVCEKKSSACDKPPKIPNAVIVHQKPQEVYPDHSKLHYQCEEGHDTDPQNAEKSITCRAGTWIQGPSCTEVSDCMFDPAQHYGSGQYDIKKIKEGNTIPIGCRQGWEYYWTFIRCQNRRILIADCK